MNASARRCGVSLLVVTTVLALSSCGGGSDADTSVAAAGSGGLPFGQAGYPDESDRTIAVEMFDTMGYEPNAIEVEPGETITFVVTNSGEMPHEFALGDASEHTRHAREMSDPNMTMHNHPYSVYLDPAETTELVWKFTHPGEFLFGCHIPGHFEAGMKGPLVVE